MNLTKELEARENGIRLTGNIWPCAQRGRRAGQLCLSQHREMSSHFSASVFSMDLEKQNERYLLCGGADGSINIFDLESSSGKFGDYKTVYPIIGSVPKGASSSHKGMIGCCQWYASDNGMFSTSSNDKTLKIWDANSLKVAESFNFEKPISAHHWSPSTHPVHSALIAVASGSSNVLLVDLRSGSQLKHLHRPSGMATSVRWSPQSSTVLCVGYNDGKVLVWDFRKGKESGYLKSLETRSRAEMDREPRPPDKQSALLKGHRVCSRESEGPRAHSGLVNCLQFSPDGLLLVSSGTEGKMKLWDGVGMEELNCWHPAASLLSVPVFPRYLIHLDMAYLPGTQKGSVLYLPVENDVEMIHLMTGRPLGSLKAHYAPVNSCVFRPSTQELITAGADKNLLVWVPPLDQNRLYTEERAGGEEALRNLTLDAWD